MGKTKDIILIVSVLFNVLLLLGVGYLNNDQIIEHNDERVITTINHLRDFAEESENYLDAESTDEKEEIALRLNYKRDKVIESYNGIMLVGSPFLGGDSKFYIVTMDITDFVIYLTNLATISLEEGEDRTELNEDETKFFSETLKEFEDFEKTFDLSKPINQEERKEFMRKGREFNDRVRELSKSYLRD